MEVSIKVPKKFLTMQKVELDADVFNKTLIEFVNLLENHRTLDDLLYNKLINLGVNKEELDKMVKEIEIFSSYDENIDTIGFPYEKWTEKLTHVYKRN